MTLLLLLLESPVVVTIVRWSAVSIDSVNVRKQSYPHPAASSAGNIFTGSKKAQVGRIGLFHIPQL